MFFLLGGGGVSKLCFRFRATALCWTKLQSLFRYRTRDEGKGEEDKGKRTRVGSI